MRRLVSFLAPLMLLLPLYASAQSCPKGNLLKGKVAKAVRVGHAARATDGIAATEGDYWKTDRVAVLRGAGASLTWDLGKLTKVEALYLQGDNNDTYTVSGSSDGVQFTPIWKAPRHPNPGMRMRIKSGLGASVRYLRVQDPVGDNAFSIGEVQAFCAIPTIWPPALTAKSGGQGKKKPSREQGLGRRKFAVGAIGLLLFIGLLSMRRSRPDLVPAVTIGLLVSALTGYALYHTVVGWSLDKSGLLDSVGARFTWAIVVAVIGSMTVGPLLLIGLLFIERVRPRLLAAATVGLSAAALTGYALYHMVAMWPLDKAGLLDSVGARQTWAIITAALGASASAGLCGYAGWRMMKAPASRWRAWFERFALVSVVLASSLAWTNFGSFHGSRSIHYWDTFHYYMGSKYFKESRYHLLYQCANIAELDDGYGKEVYKRKIRDLRDNRLGAARPQLQDQTECRANFTPARWAAFRQDLRLFRSYMGSKWWQKMFKDHGYNATPVWNMVGHWLTNADWESHIPPPELENSPKNRKAQTASLRKEIQSRFKTDRAAFQGRIENIARIDYALYAGIFLMLFWAFGLRASALAMLIWGTGHPWSYFWTGGAMGRVPWLFMAVAGLCLLKKNRHFLGGFALSWTMLLRVFPGALIAGLALKIGYGLIRTRRIGRSHLMLIAGCATALAVLIPASLPTSDGIGAYSDFIGNSMKHKKTPLTNHMGLPTLLSYHPAHVARKAKDSRLADPFKTWKQKRQSHLQDRRIVFALAIIGLLALVGWASIKTEDWEATALSVALVLGLFELTCYYYNFVILLAPLCLTRIRRLVVLMGLALSTQVVQLTVRVYDEQYTLESLLVLLTIVFLAADVGWQARKSSAAPKNEPPEAPEEPESATPATPIASTS